MLICICRFIIVLSSFSSLSLSLRVSLPSSVGLLIIYVRMKVHQDRYVCVCYTILKVNGFTLYVLSSKTLKAVQPKILKFI